MGFKIVFGKKHEYVKGDNLKEVIVMKVNLLT